ncbi:MAG TPA: hypothetical protein VFQ53_15000 [Kofleriaceae bacterium]|nr:hypothetical protein [Kofleriaceae bacterium]
MRVLVYDRTCDGRLGGLSRAWSLGSHLYRGLRRIDAAQGFDTWEAALDWVATLPEPVEELQYWGHGKWGCALVDSTVLDADALRPTSHLRRRMDALKAQLAPDALVWFRTCETFGAQRGIDFAERLADFLGARVAGHTYVIHFHQSGLHGLVPGARADWSPEEGLAEGTPEQPVRAKSSAPWATRTVSCLAGAVPETWFTR